MQDQKVNSWNMRPPCKKAAVIGGGISGLFSMKSLLDERIEPTCFEKSDDIGGAWRYHDDDTHGIPSVMRTTVLNNSKEFIFSDRVLPKEMPSCLRHNDFYDLLKHYAEVHGLRQYCHFNTEVIRIQKASDYNETGRWEVITRDTDNENITTAIFDAVLVCLGQFTYPKLIKYPGMEKFNGQILHTHSLKRWEQFSEKRIVVIGTGCSALDAASETSSVAKQVYLSVRTPAHITPRIGPKGLPMDYMLLRRHITFIQSILPIKWTSWLMETYCMHPKFNIKQYGLESRYPLLARDPIISDTIAFKLLSGAVVFRKDIKSFTENGVIFEDEKVETKVDVVIMGTGYDWNFDYLEEGIIKNEDGKFNLYKHVYPTHLKHPTLAIIGFVLPFGPGFPIAELQTRWVSNLLANTSKQLPKEEIMLTDITKRYYENCKRYRLSDKISLQVDYVPYCDEIAKELGVRPNFWKILFTDPKLFQACIFEACTSYQFRLVGPGKWAGARQAILSTYERAEAPIWREQTKQKSITVYILTNLLIPLLLACLLNSSDSKLKFYAAVPFIWYYLLRSKFLSKFLFVSFLMSSFYNDWNGFAALHILITGIIIYCNFAYIMEALTNHFWV